MKLLPSQLISVFSGVRTSSFLLPIAVSGARSAGLCRATTFVSPSTDDKKHGQHIVSYLFSVMLTMYPTFTKFSKSFVQASVTSFGTNLQQELVSITPTTHPTAGLTLASNPCQGPSRGRGSVLGSPPSSAPNLYCPLIYFG